MSSPEASTSQASGSSLPPGSAPTTNQWQLLRTRRFLPFFVTQLLGALNDNLFKNAMVLLLTFQTAQSSTLNAGVLVNLAAGIFILPFFLFSATAGQLADKFERSRIMRLVKLFEIGIAVVGAIGFIRKDVSLLFATLFMLGIHSSVFGPVKYAILPQHLRETELVGGNALVETGTFVAILVGTLIAGVLMAKPEGGTAWVPTLTALVAVSGYLASRAIPKAEAPAPDLKLNWNPLTETWRTLKASRGNRAVFNSILGISWYWFLGAMLLTQFPGYAKDYLGGGESAVTLLLTVFALGVGLGSLLCERLSGHKIEIGLVPFGSIGMSVFVLDLYFASPPAGPLSAADAWDLLSRPVNWRVLADLVLVGTFGGFYIVPLYALVQARSKPDQRSRIIAANNILNALFMVLAAAFGMSLLFAGASIPEMFLAAALLNAAVAIYIYRLVPEFLMRFLAWMLVHSVYRLRKSGLGNIPETGPAVLACNHVSFVDAIVVLAASPRPIRFIMDHQIFRIPLLSFVFRTARAIPIAPAKEDPVMLEAAYNQVAEALNEGDLVGIFPEGKITSDGELQPFKGGIARIIATTPVPVIPMALRGLWGSMFSRKGGPAFFKRPRGPFSLVELRVGEPIPAADVSPEGLQAQVAALRQNAR
ncbi:MAG: glycerol acyltransferase [Proteobacteria bacterium]|nr:MAG: glycerol acyltransferase [Pseudomonadota bacterium]